MHSQRTRSFASTTLALIFVIALAVTAVAVTALSPGEAGAAARHHAKAGAKAAAKAKASTKKTTAAADTAHFEVCDVAGTSNYDGQLFPILEASWNGAYYTSYSLTAEAAPGTCGPTYSTTPGSTVLVEEASAPLTTVSNVNVAFSVTNGTLEADEQGIALAAVSVNAGVTILTITNTPVSTPQTGTLELCKSAADRFVEGSFNFSVTAPGFSTTQGVQVNECSDLTVPAGTVSVTEGVQFPYALSSVATIPAAALVGSDLNTQNAEVSVPPNGDATVFFTNVTLTGYTKVCKTLDRSVDNVLAGQVFNYSIGATFDGAPVTGIASSLAVTAPPYGSTSCTFLTTKKGALQSLPLGSLVTVSETGLPPTIQSVGTSVSPASLSAGGSASTSQFYVGNLPPPNNVGNLGAGSVTQTTFTNEAFGYVEVCKQSSTINQGTPFQFNVGGVGQVEPPVDVGLCSQGYLLPVGTTTITEGSTPHVTVQNVSGTSQVTWSGGNTAIATVPYNNENIVTFDNEINTGTLKICKAQTSSDAGLENTTFQLAYSYTHNGSVVNGPTENLKPGQCTLPIDNVPVLNSNLTPVQISITEATTPVANVGLFSVGVVGGDSVVSSPAPPTHLLSSPGGGTPATLVINSLEGITNVTFVNGIDISG